MTKTHTNGESPSLTLLEMGEETTEDVLLLGVYKAQLLAIDQKMQVLSAEEKDISEKVKVLEEIKDLRAGAKAALAMKIDVRISGEGLQFENYRLSTDIRDEFIEMISAALLEFVEDEENADGSVD